MSELDGKSKDLINENIEKLKEIFPNIFSEGKIDFDKLQNELGEFKEVENERYNFTWAGKSDAQKIALTQSTGTLRPCKDESKNWDTTQNLYIEGDNLEVLKLLQKSYYKKVKMIYIDPPYNTGKDFVYKDNFRDNIKNYLEITGQVDSEGNRLSTNSETSGRYHSDWLSMMYPRLKLARNLLTDDGVIFISIDDNEVANLRKLCDEIFGEDNFVGDIIWNSTKSVTNTALISVSHTHNLVYFKNKEYYVLNREQFRLPEEGEGFSNPDNDTRGPWKADPFQVGGWRPNQQYEIVNPKTGKVYKPNPNCSWKNDYDKFIELEKDGRIVFGTTGDSGPQRKRFLSEALGRGKVSKTLWEDIETTTNGTQLLKKLFDDKVLFTNPKPLSLINRMLQLSTRDSDDLILDFFSGSATTAHAVMKLNSEDGGNRKFICVQLPEPTDENSEAYKAGYKNICEIGKERIRRAGDKILNDKFSMLNEKDNLKFNTQNSKLNLDIGFKVFKLDSSNIKAWDSDYENLEQNLIDSVENIKSDRSAEDLLYEVLLKYGLDLTLPITELEFDGKRVFDIGHGSLVCCLDSDIDLTLIEQIVKLKSKYESDYGLEKMRVLFRDSSFSGSVIKTNALQILKQHGIDEVVSI